MKHPLLQAFGLAARSMDAWKRLGLDDSQIRAYAFAGASSPDPFQADAYLAAWGY